MSKISTKILKKNIKDGIIKNFYYFIGEEFFLMKNFTDKIFSIKNKNFENNSKNNIDFCLFDNELLNLDQIYNAINTFPMISDKKLILITSSNMHDMKQDFFKNFIKIFSDIPDFCTVIVQDTSVQDKKNMQYLEFLKKISEISEFSEFKHEAVSAQKQAIIWAKKLNKILDNKNSKFLCQKCSNNLNSIKFLIENIVLNLNQDEKEISQKIIEEYAPKFNEKYNIYDISKAIRNKNINLAIKISDLLLNQNEEANKILSVIISDFIDAFRIQESKKSGISRNEFLNFFNYKNKEFKLNYAEILAKNFNIEKVLKLLINADTKIKSLNIDSKIILSSVFNGMIACKK